MEYVFIGLFVLYGIAIGILTIILIIRSRKEEYKNRPGKHYEATPYKFSRGDSEMNSIAGKVRSQESWLKILHQDMDELQIRITRLEKILETKDPPSDEKEEKKASVTTGKDEQTRDNVKPIQGQGTETKDKRIWVEKTNEGLKRLVAAESPGEMFLLQVQNKYHLHLTDLRPDKVYIITSLYKDIIDFPSGYNTVSSIEMVQYPEYERQKDYFVFQRKGKINITR